MKNLSFEEAGVFREKMISAVRETGKNYSGNSIKNDAIKRLEEKLEFRNIKVEKLEPENCNYREAINSSGETVE